MAGGTKEYNKTILQTSFTSLEYIYYLLEVVRKNQPMTSADGKDTIFRLQEQELLRSVVVNGPRIRGIRMQN